MITIMPKPKHKTTQARAKKSRPPKGAAKKKTSHRIPSSAPSPDVRENPMTTQVEVDELPLGGETVLPLDENQSFVGTGSGATWDYMPDPQVLDVLQATEQVDTSSNEFAAGLRNHHSESPELSGGDVDADWQRANDVGEESVGGTVATPDQDRVDELGAAVGIVYQDEEPLHTEEKLQKRDRERWELNPASKDETER
jgi:hypothetical protein